MEKSPTGRSNDNSRSNPDEALLAKTSSSSLDSPPVTNPKSRAVGEIENDTGEAPIPDR